MFMELEPRRGIIYDARMRPLAINIAVDSLYACPRAIKNRDEIIERLVPILKLERAYLEQRLARDKYFIWLARKITPEQSAQIKLLKQKELGFIKENKRMYPGGYLASHVLGFVDLDNRGLEGIELAYDKYLRGIPGWAIFFRDARQNKLALWQQMVPAKDGYDLILTIDEVIQYIAERELDRAYINYHAQAASIVVLEPKTGKILALANRPTFDLNRVSSIRLDIRRNRALADLFEPGSVFKIVTASAALEEAKVKEEDRFFCEEGTYQIGRHTLHDHRPHGWLNFREVIEQSSNIGTVKVAMLLGPEIIYRYARLFGFGQATGVDMPGEINGMLKEPKYWSKISISAVPIGQEVGVNALQLAMAISVIANGGNLMRPYVVERIQDKNRTLIKENTPQLVRRVISQDTAARIKSILQGVVENGTGKLAKPASFSAAGKTGTAQKLEPDGRYSHSKFVASFIGFAPAEDPLVSIVVVLDSPRPYYFGGVVAAPVFKNVAEDVLRYLKTNPKKEETEQLYEAKRVN